jgi:hypothetical protein
VPNKNPYQTECKNDTLTGRYKDCSRLHHISSETNLSTNKILQLQNLHNFFFCGQLN